MAEFTNTIHPYFIEGSRLGIPVVFHEECLHGHAAKDGTSFPQPIALGGTWDTDLIRRLFEMIALETLQSLRAGSRCTQRYGLYDRNMHTL